MRWRRAGRAPGRAGPQRGHGRRRSALHRLRHGDLAGRHHRHPDGDRLQVALAHLPARASAGPGPQHRSGQPRRRPAVHSGTHPASCHAGPSGRSGAAHLRRRVLSRSDAVRDGPRASHARDTGGVCTRGGCGAPTASPPRGKRAMKLYLRLLQYLRPYWVRLIAAAVCSGLVAAFTGAYAWLVRPALDEIFINRNPTWLILLPVALMIVSVLKGFASYGQTYLMTYVGNRVVADIRQRLFSHLMRLPVGFHLKNPSSRMMSRVINDVSWIQYAVSGVVKDFFQQSLTFLVLFVVVFYQNWQLTLLSSVVIPLSIYPMVRFGNRLRRFATIGQERTADMSTALQETLTGIRIVKGFTQESAEDRRFARHNEAYFRAGMKSTQVSAFTSPVLEAIGVIGVAGIIWYGGSQVIRGTMTPGTCFSFLTAMFLMYNPIKRLASSNNTIQQALSAAERVFAVLDVETEAAIDTGVRGLDGVQSSMELRGVSFRYDGVETWALRDISLTVRAGEVLALVGSSGAGKTTLVNLIPRFYDPTEGALLIDGVDLREIRLAALRRQIGIVSQETLLFDDTVRNNIAYGKY